MDQGSVVVLFRRTTHSSFVAIVSINRDLYYSGLNPTVTTSDPRSIAEVSVSRAPYDTYNGSGISSGYSVSKLVTPQPEVVPTNYIVCEEK